MWEYQIKKVSIKDPSDSDIEYEMNKFGSTGWNIFSITEKVVDKWNSYGDPHETIEYTMYMKKLVTD